MRVWVVSLLMVFGGSVPGAVGQELYWPGVTEWETVSPEDAGFDDEKLKEALQYAERYNTRGLLILRGGRIVLERYWGQGNSADTADDVFEVHLGMLGVLAQMAVERGELESLDQKMTDFIPSWKGTGKNEITLRHIMSMTSGLRPSWFRSYDVDDDQFLVNARMSLQYQPGEVYRDNLPGAQLIYGVI
ncbi:MAG: serine hydrolase, partial [Planctomycetota bacterium]